MVDPARVRTNAGMLHRGFEKSMEKKPWAANLSLIPRVCVVDPDPNEVAYCQAIETLLGVEVPRRARYLRALTLEMSRLTSFLMGMGALGGSLGHYTPMYLMMLDRDWLLDLFEALTGARVYHIYNVPGGVRRDMPEGWPEKLLKVVDTLEERLLTWDRLLFENRVVHEGWQKASTWFITHFVDKVKTLGAELLPTEGPLVIAANHPGAYDSLVITSQIPRDDVKIISSDIPNALNIRFWTSEL